MLDAEVNTKLSLEKAAVGANLLGVPPNVG